MPSPMSPISSRPPWQNVTRSERLPGGRLSWWTAVLQEWSTYGVCGDVWWTCHGSGPPEEAVASAISPSDVAMAARRAIAALPLPLCAEALVLSSTRPRSCGPASGVSSHRRAAARATIPPYECPTSTT